MLGAKTSCAKAIAFDLPRSRLRALQAHHNTKSICGSPPNVVNDLTRANALALKVKFSTSIWRFESATPKVVNGSAWAVARRAGLEKRSK